MSAAPRPEATPPSSDRVIEPRRGGLWAYGHGFLYALDLTRELPAARPVSGEIRRLQAEDVPALRWTMGPGHGRLIDLRRGAGRDCYVLTSRRRIESYCWVAYEDEGIGAFERKIHIRPGEAYIFDCVTLPTSRGHGFYPAVLGRIARELKARGLALIWIGADASNVASQRGILKAGFGRVVEIRYLRLLRHRWLRIEPDPASPGWLAEAARRALQR